MQRRQLETAAANYSYLRGLLFVPLGALSLLAALGNWQVGPLRHDWVFVAVAAAIGLSYLPISRYYNDNYGRLSPSTREQVRVAAGAPSRWRWCSAAPPCCAAAPSGRSICP